MDYEEWRGFYKAILKDLGFSREKDIEAARVLKDLVEPLPLEVLEKEIAGRRVCIYGAGQSLEEVKEFPAWVKIAANGATSYLLEKGVVPEVIVTDLDGKLEDLYRANSRGSIMVIHAHGDNIDKIRTHASRFRRVVPTCQCRPFDGLHNFGGFTDGDRAVFMAVHLGAREIVLYGMDFKGVGRYSFSGDTLRKRKKLKWGKKLIDYLKAKSRVKITWSR
jgi:hypothetical protein